MINWHRLFGLNVMDFFTDSYYEVKLEENLTLQEQFLDLVILQKSTGKPPPFLPDGFDNLNVYNLISYKSLHEPLDGWMLDELVGAYTIYRKQVSPSPKALVPLSQFQLYAVCTRYSHFLSRGLKNQSIKEVGTGVYEINSASQTIRMIVLNAIPTIEKNALWLLFSGNSEGFVFGNKHYHWHQPKSKQLLNQLYELYHEEGFIMPYTLDDYYREYTIPFIESLPPEIRLRGLSAEERLKDVPVEQRLKDIPVEQRLKEVSIEDRLKDVPVEQRLKEISIEDRLKGLPSEIIEEYLSKLKSSH